MTSDIVGPTVSTVYIHVQVECRPYMKGHLYYSPCLQCCCIVPISPWFQLLLTKQGHLSVLSINGELTCLLYTEGCTIINFQASNNKLVIEISGESCSVAFACAKVHQISLQHSMKLLLTNAKQLPMANAFYL